MKKVQRKRKGSALIVVLALVFLFSLLAITMITSSEVLHATSKIHDFRASAVYDAESAVSRARWALMKERFDQQEGELVEAPERRYTTEHDGLTVTVTILDANSGLSLAGSLPGSQLRGLINSDEFCDELDDYVDDDDLRRLAGKESGDYDVELLPRNSQLYTRDEVYWLPSVTSGFGSKLPEPETFAVIHPDLPSGKPSFFAAPPSFFRLLGFGDDEINEIIRIREDPEPVGPITERLGLLYPKLRDTFSFSESGVYEIRVAVIGPTGARREVTVIQDFRKAAGSDCATRR